MSLSLSVTITGAQDLLKLQHYLDPKLLAKAARGGMTYAGKAAKVAVAKEVGARYNLKAARIKADVSGPRFSPGGQTATLILSNKPPSALSYGGRDVGKGLFMRVPRSGRAVRVQRGFIARSGKLQGKPFRRLTDERTSQLAFVSGPSVGRIFGGDSEYGDALRSTVQARINEQFIKGMQRVLDSAARGYGGR